LLLRQLFFEHGAQSDAARKRITRANCQRGAQLSDEKPKINSPRGLPFGALISHACSTEWNIAGAVGARASLLPSSGASRSDLKFYSHGRVRQTKLEPPLDPFFEFILHTKLWAPST